MEKRALHDIQNKKPMKQSDKKRLFKKKLARFLVSDCYMFAPLVSRTKHYLSPAKVLFIDDDTGVKTRERGDEKKRKLEEKIGGYLISDDYMYAPLVDTPITSSTSDTLQDMERVQMAISAGKITFKESRPMDPLSNVTLEKDLSKGCTAAEAETRDQQTPSQKETVKHMVYQNCRSYLSVREAPVTRSRKLLID